MTPLKVAEKFVAAINSADVEAIGKLMTPDHIFIDTDGSEHGGRDRMKPGWREYFDMVPDFQIEIVDRIAENDLVVLLGQASGTFVQDGELKPENHWSVPAAWRVVVDSKQVSVWQLYANQEIMREILERIRAA